MVHRVEIEEVNTYEPKVFPFLFIGSVGGYYKIWLINILLTILSLGIYSAWGKLKSQRYFYGNTTLAATPFEYQANPWQILIGRAIAVVLVVIYFFLFKLNFTLGISFLLISLAAVPFIAVRIIRFKHRASAYRNIHFHFSGHEKEAALAYLLWPLLSILTFGLLTPFAHQRISHFYVNHSAFGNVPLKTEASVPDYYKFYLALFGPIAALFIALAYLLPLPAIDQLSLSSFNPFDPAFSTALIPFYIAVFLLFFLYYAFSKSVITNLILNSASLGNYLFFRSRLSLWKMFGITLTNVLAIILTLGIAYPWARVRIARYRAEHIMIRASGSIDTFINRHVDTSVIINDADENDIGI